MDFGDLVLEARVEEFLRFYESAQPFRMIRVLGDNENKGMNLGAAGDAVIAVEFDGDMVMIMHCVFELDAFQLVGINCLGIKIRACSDGWFFYEAIGHRLAEAVAIRSRFEMRLSSPPRSLASP